MKSILATGDMTWQEAQAAGKEYRWKDDGADGLRSYSYDKSNPDWNYAEQTGTDSNGVYTFTDSSTGQPSARRGNLYNMTAATLGSSFGITYKQAPNSICPRGWQLPAITTSSLSASADEMTNKSWARLFRIYGISDGTDVASVNRPREWPLEYLPTGSYYYSFGFINNRTAGGYWWSGVVSSTTDSYSMRPYSDKIRVQFDGPRGDGFALRCGSLAQSMLNLSANFSFFADRNRGEYLQILNFLQIN